MSNETLNESAVENADVTPTSENENGLKKWINEHPDLWEFILFNILSNVSTASRFIVLWVLTPLFVNAMALTAPFHFMFYNYDTKDGGLGIFLATIIAEIVAQTVNFFVQMKWVFKSDSNFKDAAWKYIVLAIIIIIISGFAPSYISAWANSIGWGGISSTLTAVFNTLMAVVVSYPLLKFWIMPKSKEEKAEEK
ncbi:PTS cellobiose transporter subunit IIC [Alloscardovia theropitheci]|uniref:PTS cellobiose transporter subunit IIC n=1 Tax=Alloscardovia theropitheci TaxID=2496842 RepID=A0A4R0QPX6_9BIFI|nr:GtrA family protein [Alloscardovia theropitheci]TCD54314.1 PTS cellobiose transporter subunit IIC [Alloscardovia theropitheci]